MVRALEGAGVTLRLHAELEADGGLRRVFGGALVGVCVEVKETGVRKESLESVQRLIGVVLGVMAGVFREGLLSYASRSSYHSGKEKSAGEEEGKDKTPPFARLLSFLSRFWPSNTSCPPTLTRKNPSTHPYPAPQNKAG